VTVPPAGTTPIWKAADDRKATNASGVFAVPRRIAEVAVPGAKSDDSWFPQKIAYLEPDSRVSAALLTALLQLDNLCLT
jgi:hypothetical protein